VLTAERILAIEASAGACSAALWRRDAVVASRYAAMERGHAEALMPMIVATLADAAESLRTLDAVAVTVGPGAFTGIRIGLATARGIGLAAGIPVVGVTTFAAVAAALAPVLPESTVIVLIDSKRGDVFAQRFSGALEPIGPPTVLAPVAAAGYLPAAPVLLAGDGVDLVRPHLASARPDVAYAHTERGPDAVHVAPLAACLIAAGGGLPPVPLYLRAPDVRLPGPVATSAPAGRP